MGKSTGPLNANKTLDIAVDAIETLKELPGSTSRDIINYITENYPVERDAAGKQVRASLKRGIAYGIFIRKAGRYSLPIESDGAGEEIAKQEIGLIEMCRRKRGSGPRRNKKARTKRSSRETAAASNCKKRRSGKRRSCGGASLRGRSNKRKSYGQDHRTAADSCCCCCGGVRYKSRLVRRSRKSSVNKRNENKYGGREICEFGGDKFQRLRDYDSMESFAPVY